MLFRELLTKHREHAKLNISELAGKLNITPSYIGNLEKGYDRPPTITRCKEIAAALSLSPDETKMLINAAMEERIPSETAEWIRMKEDEAKKLFQREKQSPGGKFPSKGSPMLNDPDGSGGLELVEVKKIPIISWAHANQFSSIEDPFPPGVADTYIESTTIKGANVFALTVMHNCMEPEFQEGDIIIIDPNRDPVSGDFVIVKDLDAQEATFKQLKKSKEEIFLHPLNPKHKNIKLDHNKRYQIVGVVIKRVREKKY